MTGDDQLRKAERLRQLTESASVELVNEDHSVRVIVGPGGAVHDIETTHRAAKYSGTEIAGLVMDLLAEANRDMARQMNDLLADVLGPTVTPPDAEAITGMPTLEEIQRQLRDLRGATD